MIIDIETIGREATAKLDQSRRGELGQFFSPKAIAGFMASLFEASEGPIHLLEAGAGVGTLIAGFLSQLDKLNEPVDVTAYEIDPLLISYLDENLEHCKRQFLDQGRSLSFEVLNRDFIFEGCLKVLNGEKLYTHAILNPPYKKMHSKSEHRHHLAAIGQEHVNLYSAFVGLALAQLQTGGQLVAIIPRSFCNGLYYKPFRKYLLYNSALMRLHLFNSRTSAFKDDAVLQENIIIHLIKGRQQGPVIVSQSTDHLFRDLKERQFSFEEIIKKNDDERFIYVPHLDGGSQEVDTVNVHTTLDALQVQVSTGPVVDFRVKDHLRQQPEIGTVPLFYPAHFNGKELDWPRQIKKPNAIVVNSETRSSLWPTGFYTVVRRFSSKEEKQRIVARVINPANLESELIGLENHLNVFHFKKSGLEADVAYGLAAYLNSSFVDRYFRSFNGHTQVNAGDLKRLRYPNRIKLAQLGKEAKLLPELSPATVDSLVSKYL